MPQRILDYFAAVLTFLRQWAWAFIAGGILLGGLAFFRSCSLSQQANAVFQRQPPLPSKATKAIIRAGKQDSVLAVRYQRIAQRATARADSLQALRRVATHQVILIHEQIIRLPAATGGPLTAVARRLTNYTPADSTGF